MHAFIAYTFILRETKQNFSLNTVQLLKITFFVKTNITASYVYAGQYAPLLGVKCTTTMGQDALKQRGKTHHNIEARCTVEFRNLFTSQTKCMFYKVLRQTIAQFSLRLLTEHSQILLQLVFYRCVLPQPMECILPQSIAKNKIV